MLPQVLFIQSSHMYHSFLWVNWDSWMWYEVLLARYNEEVGDRGKEKGRIGVLEYGCLV